MRRRLWTRAAIVLVTGALTLPSTVAAQGRARGWRDDRPYGRGARGYQEPAYARGYRDGYQRGWNDGRERDRYDPVGHRDYREADQGYYGSYGSRHAYRNNYRAGFRPGYEEGFREGASRGARR